MFIKRKRFEELCERVENAEECVKDLLRAINELHADTLEKLDGTNERVTDLEHALQSFTEFRTDTVKKLEGLDEFLEVSDATRKQEQAYFDGLQNVFGFGVTNGK